ncbi:MAG: DUF1653 domain-containing protein [Candidatus Woesearchaeota archaeon]
MEKLKLGKYRNFKGHLYEVIGIAKHSETLEELVLYKRLDANFNEFWVRPLSMFLEKVEFQGKIVPRFELLE